MSPDSPTPNVRKQEASSSSPSEIVHLRRSTSPESRASKMIRHQSPVPEEVDSHIHEIIEAYKENSEKILYSFKDDLINVFRNAKLKQPGENPNFFLRDLLDRCMLRSRGFANSNVVQWEMTPEILDYITAVLGETPIVKESPLVWLPPEFYQAETYCYRACMDDTQVFDFGYFKGEQIQGTMEGSVECWGEDHFSGRGTMTIAVGSGRLRRIDIKVVVLGYIICTGTGILLDASSRIWFYNVPDSVDLYLEGNSGQVPLVAIPSTGMTKYTEVRFLERYDKVDVVVKEHRGD